MEKLIFKFRHLTDNLKQKTIAVNNSVILDKSTKVANSEHEMLL